MRFKLIVFLAVLAFVASFTYNANAQYMTQDIIFVKAGYIPNYTIDPKNSESTSGKGFALQGEYNLNFSGFWLGFGMEYQYHSMESDSLGDYKYSFLLPMASVKVAAVGGLYVGGGFSGKYLIGADEPSGYSATKYIDLWVNGILGYHFPVAEGVFLDLEGRFGWNLTNKQFSKIKLGSTTYTQDMDSAYDIAFYFGVGFRAFGSNY